MQPAELLALRLQLEGQLIEIDMPGQLHDGVVFILWEMGTDGSLIVGTVDEALQPHREEGVQIFRPRDVVGVRRCVKPPP